MNADGSVGNAGMGSAQNNIKICTNGHACQIFGNTRSWKKYMQSAGMVESLREDNFGKLWQIKGCAELQYYYIQNISAHNTQKTQNPPKRASAIWCKTPSLHQKSWVLTRATKTPKKPTNTTNRITFAKIMHVKSSQYKKKQHMVRKIAKKRVSDSEANVHTSKHAKVRNWSQKNRQAVRKSNAKNKATLRSHI